MGMVTKKCHEVYKFIGPGKSRASIYQALDTSDCMIRLTKLNIEIENLRQKSVLSHPTLGLQTLGSRTWYQDFSPYIDCLTRYDILEKSKDYKDYTRRYKQLLLQIFSRDSVLQLVPSSAIPLLLEYSDGGPPDEQLGSLIPALGMIFINTPTVGNDKELVDMPELRRLSGTLTHRAILTFNDLVNNRNLVHIPLQPPQSLPRDWEDNGAFYGHPPIRHRPYYEGRDNDKNIDASESGQCKKYYLTYGKQTLTGGVLALWCPHLICLGFHKIPRAEGWNDVFSALYVYFEQAPEVVIYDFVCCRGFEQSAI